MEYGGKITQRFWMPKQLGTDDALAHEIRATASVDQRDLQSQIRFLLMLGIEHRRLQVSQGHMPQVTHVGAYSSTLQNSSTSRVRTSEHKDSRGQLPNQLLLPNTAGPIPTRKKRAMA